MSSIMDRYLKDPPKDPTPNGEAFQGSSEHGGSQTLDRPVLMLDLVLADCTRIAYSYATLGRVLMEPDRGIVLSFATDEVLIEGTVLEGLYKAIIQHRASRIEISDANRNIAVVDEGKPRITAIQIVNSDHGE